MPWRNKVIWSEGLFMRPQHFQQNDRYLEYLIDSRCQPLQPYGWGFTDMQINRDMLSLGTLSLADCKGVFSDGTPFEAPHECPLPAPLTVPETTQQEIIHLALPLRRPGSAETQSSHAAPDVLTRYHTLESDVRDNNAGYDAMSSLELGQLRLRLMLDSEDRSCYSCLPLARVVEVRSDQGIILDEGFLPTALTCTAHPTLAGFVRELHGMLRNRAETLAGRVTDAARGGVSEIADFMLLQVVNRYDPLVAHLNTLPTLHPEMFYRFGVQIAGELATFTTNAKRSPEFPVYQHDDLAATLTPLMKALRQSLTTVLEQNAIPINLEERGFGVRVAPVGDVQLLRKGIFVLAVKADMASEKLQTLFPAQIKIGPVEHISHLVNSGLPGIGLRALPTAPRQLPYHAGFTYFELDRSNQYWSALEKANAFALHIAGDFPGLELEFWAVRG